MEYFIWAATWQNQQSECAPSEDSDQPSLIRVFAVRMKKTWVLSYPLRAQRRLWSDWADAQADLSLRWVHTHFVGFVMRRLISLCIMTVAAACFSYNYFTIIYMYLVKFTWLISPTVYCISINLPYVDSDTVVSIWLGYCCVNQQFDHSICCIFWTHFWIITAFFSVFQIFFFFLVKFVFCYISGHTNVVDELLKAGAARTLKMGDMTPVDIARDFDHTEILALLELWFENLVWEQVLGLPGCIHHEHTKDI